MHRGRDVLQVLDQYERTVKPSFESYILPTKKHADIIVGYAEGPSIICRSKLLHLSSILLLNADSTRGRKRDCH